MVQLSTSPNLDVCLPPECSDEGEEIQEDPAVNDGSMVGHSGLSTVQLKLDVSTAYHGYENYIEDGLICLNHKVRNMEKKKVGRPLGRVNDRFESWRHCPGHLDFVMYLVCSQLKLENYKKRLTQGETLNKDQMVR